MRFAAILALVASPSLADSPCFPLDQLDSITATALDKFGEAPAWVGISQHDDGSPGAAIELLLDPTDGSWTLLTLDQDQFCITTYGVGAMVVKPGKPA